MKSIISLLVAVAAIGLIGVQSDSTAQQTSVVHIASFAFQPANLTINAGDTVTFVNDDAVAHTATASDKSFDSGNLDQNAKWSHRFDTAGTFNYVCSYHSMMKGTITVKAAQ